MKFSADQLILGLRGVILDTSVGDSIEAILPASLGYGYMNNGSIPAGSTLIFKYRVEEVKK